MDKTPTQLVGPGDLGPIPPSAEIVVWFDGREQVPPDDRDVLLELRYPGDERELCIGHCYRGRWQTSLGIEVPRDVKIHWAEVTGPA